MAQQQARWSATTGDVSLTAQTTAATIQQAANSPTDVVIEQIVVYCSVACNATQAANGSAATSTAGTIYPLLPVPLNWPPPFTFWTASNVGSGTTQGGIMHLAAGQTVTFCLSKACGAGGDVTIGKGAASAANYTVNISSITGTANITFYLRSNQ
jgi:hypothetical protein